MVCVSAFWTADLSGGLGVKLPFENRPEGDGIKFCQELQRHLVEYDARPEPDYYIAQLREWGSRRGELTDEEMLLAIRNVYWLQERGHLRKDEYNGVLFVWTVEKSKHMTMMTAEQNPVVIDVNAAARSGIDTTEIMVAILADPFRPKAALTTVLDYARIPKTKTDGASS